MTETYTLLGPEPTHAAIIFCGLKNTKTGVVHPRSVLDNVCQKYVDAVGLCVSVRDIDYIYTNGREPGISVTLINYPRFPSTPEIIRRHAVALAEQLRVAAEQERVTVMTSKDTVTLQDRSIADCQCCTNMQERNRQLEMQLRGARNDKVALSELADYREKQVIRLTKRITELEWAIAEIAKKIWWPRIRSLARFVLSGSIRD